MVPLATLLFFPLAFGSDAPLGPTTPAAEWGKWVVALFLFCFALGIVAVLGGVGGGVLFVPIVSSFFPFHLDFVRGAGLLVALSAATTASASLLKSGHASIRLGTPFALVAGITAILGAMVGLAAPTQYVQIALGITILGICAVMYWSKKSDYPEVPRSDRLGGLLGLHGHYYEASLQREVYWRTHRTGLGLLTFGVIGFMAGMFGLGAGWANVPALNLLLGAPLKLSVGTSQFILTIADSAAAWIYLHQGAILAVIAIPSVIGIMLGSMIGTRLLKSAQPKIVRSMILVLLAVAGGRALLKGLGI